MTEEPLPEVAAREFLRISAGMDEMVDHPDNCGHCGHLIVMAQTARDFIEEGRLDVGEYLNEIRRRWKGGKYFKAYQEALRLGRNPAEFFAELGLGEP